MVLLYIDMNPPRVYMSSQSWTPLPPTTPYHLSGSSPCTRPKHPVSCIEHSYIWNSHIYQYSFKIVGKLIFFENPFTHTQSHPTLCGSPLTVPLQAPLPMGLLRQEYWSGWPLLSPGDLPDPRMEAMSPALAGRFFTTEAPEEPLGSCLARS